MFFQRYVHVVLDAVLGSYVKNIDPDALKISVWNGKIEVDAVELQPDALSLPPQLRLVKGTLHQLRIDLPWANLASEPIRVDIQDVSLLLQVQDEGRAEREAAERELERSPEEQRRRAAKRQQKLQRKRATLDAYEKASEFNEKHKLAQQTPRQGWTHSFFFKLLVKALDNLQVQVQHLHIRMEDACSSGPHPYAVGVTLESIIIKSADEGWNYTMVVRKPEKQQTAATPSFLRKKMDINKFGVYWSMNLMPVPASVLDDGLAFAKVMQQHFALGGGGAEPDGSDGVAVIFRPGDYLVHPLTVSMKLTINDGNAKLPLTHHELSQRVLSRLGTPWLVETIDAIGDDAWREFVAAMPKLAGERKYTLSFVFSEAWSVARELTEEEDAIPSVEQFKEALSSCLQWSSGEVERMEHCIVKYREAVVHVMEEKSTYIDAVAHIDDISISLHRKQYLSALSLISFFTVKRRQARYLPLRPKGTPVRDNPRLWWNYAINAVLLDVRERLARVDWDSIKRKREQQKRYQELYLVQTHLLSSASAASASTAVVAGMVSPEVRAMSKEIVHSSLEDLEFAIDVQDLIKLRHSAKNDLATAQREDEKKRGEQAAAIAAGGGAGAGAAGTAEPGNQLAALNTDTAAGVPASSRLWAYASWLTGASSAATSSESVQQGEQSAVHDGDETPLGAEPKSILAVKNANPIPATKTVRAEDVKWSDQDTKDLYDAIDFHPDEDADDDTSTRDSESSNSVTTAQQRQENQERQHIWYRFQLHLSKAGFGLSLEDVPIAGNPNTRTVVDSDLQASSSRVDEGSAYLMASLDDVQIQFLVRPSSVEMGLQLRDAFFSQSGTASLPSAHEMTMLSKQRARTDFFLQRMAMDEILRYHPEESRRQMNSVRLHDCERELPLISLGVEAERPLQDTDEDENDMTAADSLTPIGKDAATSSSVLRISLVTQAIKCNVNLMFLLDVVAVFSRPLNVDLSGLEQSAWKRAQSLQRYSAAQLNDALARRTRIELQLDVISPLINIIQSPVATPSDIQGVGITRTSKDVSLLVFLGHLRAATKQPLDPNTTLPTSSDAGMPVMEPAIRSRFTVPSPDELRLYDVLDFSISGIEVQILDQTHGDPFVAVASTSPTSAWRFLLEKTSLTFSFHTSVTPDDPGIPLLKLFGGLASVHLNMSAASFRSLMELLRSFGADFSAHAERRLMMSADESDVSHGENIVVNGGVAPTSRSPVKRLMSRRVSTVVNSSETPVISASSLQTIHRHEHASSHVPGTGDKAKDADDQDLLKLWKRVICQMQFIVGDVTLKFQLGDAIHLPGKVVRARAADIRTDLIVRSFDRRLEFALGTFSLEEVLFAKPNPTPADVDGGRHDKVRYLMKSGSQGPMTGEDRGDDGEHDSSISTDPPAGGSTGRLISVAITSISSEAVLPKDQTLWASIAHHDAANESDEFAIWQDTLLTPLSVDMNLEVLTIHFFQETFAEIFLFFFQRDEQPSEGGVKMDQAGDAELAGKTLEDLAAGDDKIDSSLDVPDQEVPLAGEDTAFGSPGSSRTHEGTFSKKLGTWMATSFLDNMNMSENEHVAEESRQSATQDDSSSVLPASLQFRIHVDGLSLYLHLEEKERGAAALPSSVFATLTAQRFCCCMHRFPRYFSIYSYLSSLKICDASFADKHLREIISHGESAGLKASPTWSSEVFDGSSSHRVGHVPSLEEILNTVNRVPAVFSCAAQFYGADNIQEPWHPGFSSRYSLRLKSPRIRFLYSFIDDMRNYLLKGVLLETIMTWLSRDNAEMVWEGDFQLSGLQTGLNGGANISANESIHDFSSSPPGNGAKTTKADMHGAETGGGGGGDFLGSDVVSMFPLVDVQLEDAVLEMPPHRMSSEALVLRFDHFRVSNEHVNESFEGMDNKIVAKVLLNSSLTQLKLSMTTLRIVSVILVDRSLSPIDPDGIGSSINARGGGFITQSLLGSTNFTLSVDFRSRNTYKLAMNFKPVRLVCNQEQYSFVLRVPLQNYRERTRYPFLQRVQNGDSAAAAQAVLRQHSRSRSLGGLSTDSGHNAHSDGSGSLKRSATVIPTVDGVENRYIVLSMQIPEITMEILQGQEGYHPSGSGDLDMAEKGRSNPGSICVLELTRHAGNVDYNLTTGRFRFDIDFEGIHIRDSRTSSNFSTTYREVVVFENHTRDRADHKAVSIQFARESFTVDPEKVEFDSTDFSFSRSQSHNTPRSVKSNPSPMGRLFTPRTRFRSASSRALVGLFGHHELSRAISDSSMSRQTSQPGSVPSHHESNESDDDGEAASTGVEAVEVNEPAVGTETRIDLTVEVSGFRVIPSNIYYDVLQFLSTSSSSDASGDISEIRGENQGRAGARNDDGANEQVPVGDDMPMFRRIRVEINLGPSVLLMVEDPQKLKSRALMLSWEASIAVDYLCLMNEESMSSSPQVHSDYVLHPRANNRNQLQVCVAVDNAHASSRMPGDSLWAEPSTSDSSSLHRSTSADCLKPIGLETVLQMDLSTRFLRFRSTFDRVMELRFGYLDFCTMLSALEHIVRRPSADLQEGRPMSKRRTSSTSSVSSLNSAGGESDTSSLDRRRSLSTERNDFKSDARTRDPKQKTVARYGSSRVYLASATSRGRLETRPVVGFYSSTWKKRYLVLPFSAQERNQVEGVAFRILPARGSRRQVGDEVYYGDRIILEAILSSSTTEVEPSSNGQPDDSSDAEATTDITPKASSAVICKYDQLGAIGYLGPDGTAGAFETTIWKHGSTMFNSDRSAIYDHDIIVFEELTIYRSFGNARQQFGASTTGQTMDFTSTRLDQQIEGAHSVGITGARGGGYLMFNGVGDAPIPFAMSIVPSKSPKHRHRHADTEPVESTVETPENDGADGDDCESHHEKKETKKKQLLSFLENLKVIEFTLPGMNATVVNDFHNMLLPLLHFRVANLHADIRGRFDAKYTALVSLRFGVQAYNSQLAVWEPVVEDFDVNAAFHAKGGVLCDYCMSERYSVSPTGVTLRCDGIPFCLFRSSRTEVYTNAAAHAWESKNFIYRELLEQPDDGARHANTFLAVINGDLNVNLSRNVINVMLHFFALVTKATGSDERMTTRLGPFIYVDNQSGIPFLVATHPAISPSHPPPAHAGSRRETGSGSVDVPSEVPSTTDTNEEIVQNETATFHNQAWSRRRLSTLLHAISSPTTRWTRVESGQRIPTDIVAHEAPAGSVTSPLRRLLWLKPQSISRIQAASKPIPVPIGYSNRSYLHLESSSSKKVESWHGESVICETVAEQGTLVLRLRGKIQLTNYFSVPIEVVYNGERKEVIAPGGKAAHYVPIQFLEDGAFAFRPVLEDGKLQPSESLRISALLRSRVQGRFQRQQSRNHKQHVGALELRKALTFYWDELPSMTDGEDSDPDSEVVPSSVFHASLPPFQVIMTAVRKSERHETIISLRPPIQLENLVPYELSYRTVCMKTEDEIVWVDKNSASFSGSSGRVACGSTACIAELEILSSDGMDTGDEDCQTPTAMGLSLAIPEIGLRRFSPWSNDSLIYGTSRPLCERIELSMPEKSGSDAYSPANKLTICVEMTRLEKLHSRGLNALAPMVCRVFTEYWLIDRTSLSLAFYTADGYRIPSNYPAGQQDPSSSSPDQPIPSAISLSVYSSESKQHVSKMKIGIKGKSGEREVQSDPFDISAVGVRGQILVPTSRARESRSLLTSIAEFGIDKDSSKVPRKQYEFGVMVEQGPAKFSRSRVVTLVPRFYLVNTSSIFEIHLRQEQSGSREVLVLRPRDSKVFHWSDYRLPQRVQVKFVVAGTRESSQFNDDLSRSSQWSAPFELSSVGNFVLRVKANRRSAPAYLSRCFEGGAGASQHHSEEDNDELFYDYSDDDVVAQQLLANDIQLNVAVELHDPSFFVYLEQGSDALPLPQSIANGEGAAASSGTTLKESSFVPYRIKNECNNLELVVWQKTFTKDEKGNITIGFEGGETVLPFHTIDYVPYRFAASPTVMIQVQKVVGLAAVSSAKKDKAGRHKARQRATAGSGGGTTDSTVLAVMDNLAHAQQVIACFEVQLKKLQRLPTIDISDGKMKKRLWAEVLLDETSKTLLVTDMLPGLSGEHKRRRRATLLRSWKTFNSSISVLSRAISVHEASFTSLEVGEDGGTAEGSGAVSSAQKKKRVRFALEGQDETKEVSSGFAVSAPSGATGEGAAEPRAGEHDIVSGLAISVRLVEAIGLEHLFVHGGRAVDFGSIHPFLVFHLKEGGTETRTKLMPQPSITFPRWLPIATANTVLSAFIKTPNVDKLGDAFPLVATDAEIFVEIREPDKLLFSSSVVSTVRIPLQEYCASAIRSFTESGNFGDSKTPRPFVVEFLVPVRSKDGTQTDSDCPTLLRFEVSSQYLTTIAGHDGDDVAAPVAAVTEALRYYELQKGLTALVQAKSQLKNLLEREAVDTSTGGGSVHSFSASSSSPSADPPLSERKRSGLTQLPDEESSTAGKGRAGSHRSSVASVTTDESNSDGTYEEMGDDKRLTAVLVGVSNLEIPEALLQKNFVYSPKKRYEPKIYCTITYQESTRSALSVMAKSSTSSESQEDSSNPSRNLHQQQVRTHEFPRGQSLGLDLVYQNGRVVMQGVVCDGPCGALLFEGKIRIGDTVVAVNHRSIVNLRRESSFGAIERAMAGNNGGEEAGAGGAEEKATFSLSFLYQPSVSSQRHLRTNDSGSSSGRRRSSTSQEDAEAKRFDAEWNRRVEFTEEPFDNKQATSENDAKVLVRVYLRNETSDHGLSASQESSIVPFLYFFGDDAMMDHLDHSKQDSRFDMLLAECWVPLPPSTPDSLQTGLGNPMAGPAAGGTFHERICALYAPQLQRSNSRQHGSSSLDMIGQLRLALKWDFINPLAANKKVEDVRLYCQLEVARICISIVDDASVASSAVGPHQPREVLSISLSNQRASAGIQLSYGMISDGRHVVNARVGHFQIDNQLLDTNYPVLLHPMRLVDAQLQAEGKLPSDSEQDAMLLPTLQLMAVFSRQPNVIQFEYIFGQLQELEIKLEDATLVALAQVFYGINWSSSNGSDRATATRSLSMTPRNKNDRGSNLALRLLEKEWSTPTKLLTSASESRLEGGFTTGRRGGNTKVLLRWLLLCPVKVNVTFTSTADRSLLLSLLSPDLSSALSTIIGAAAALVSNLDQAPIRIPEFYVENLLETTHTLAFYAIQHYIHHGLRSWYSIVGSVDFLGNPIGLVSTLGTGVKDFFYTPAQMLLEDEKGLRIENLRTGMTKGSKSLLRNTAVGIFHTTGKITETLGKGIAMLAMDEQYNVQRQRQSNRQTKKINDLGDAIAEGSRGLVGGVWDGIKGVVAAPVRGAEQSGAGGFVVGIGKGFAGLIVKPTAGFLDLLTSLSRGAKSSAEQLDGTDRDAFDAVTRFRLPRRICADGVVVSYSEREARGFAVLLLTSLDETDDYVYHVDYGMKPHRGLVMLTDKRIICLNANTGQKLWEVALDSRLDVSVEGAAMKIGQSTSPSRTYNIECDDAVTANNFRVAVDSARVDLSATRYLLLNLEKNQEEARITGGLRDGSGGNNDDDERTELHVLMENVQDTTVTGVTADDLTSQPIRSVRVELCHLLNKDAHANVPKRSMDRVFSFSVYQIQVYGGPYQWSVYRRYSEFRDLCTQLEAQGFSLDSLPPLPARTVFPSTRDGVAKPRQEALNMFLQAASMHSTITRSLPMLEFLTREAQEVRVSLPPLSPSGARMSPSQPPDDSL